MLNTSCQVVPFPTTAAGRRRTAQRAAKASSAQDPALKFVLGPNISLERLAAILAARPEMRRTLHQFFDEMDESTPAPAPVLRSQPEHAALFAGIGKLLWDPSAVKVIQGVVDAMLADDEANGRAW